MSPSSLKNSIVEHTAFLYNSFTFEVRLQLFVVTQVVILSPYTVYNSVLSGKRYIHTLNMIVQKTGQGAFN